MDTSKLYALSKLPHSNSEEDMQWRITATTQDKTKGLAVPYVDTRAI